MIHKQHPFDYPDDNADRA